MILCLLSSEKKFTLLNSHLINLIKLFFLLTHLSSVTCNVLMVISSSYHNNYDETCSKNNDNSP